MALQTAAESSQHMNWAESWRDRVIEAFDENDVANLNKLAAAALRASPSTEDLLCGAGYLLKDAYVWRDCSDEAIRAVTAAQEKWKKERGTFSGPTVAKPSHPLGPLRAKGF